MGMICAVSCVWPPKEGRGSPGPGDCYTPKSSFPAEAAIPAVLSPPIAHSQAAFQGHTAPVSSAVFSPDGRRVLTSENKQIDKAVDAPWKYTVEVSDARTRRRWTIEMSAPYMTPRLYCSSWTSQVLARPQPCSIWLGLSLNARLERARNDIKERVPVRTGPLKLE